MSTNKNALIGKTYKEIKEIDPSFKIEVGQQWRIDWNGQDCILTIQKKLGDDGVTFKITKKEDGCLVGYSAHSTDFFMDGILLLIIEKQELETFTNLDGLKQKKRSLETFKNLAFYEQEGIIKKAHNIKKEMENLKNALDNNLHL